MNIEDKLLEKSKEAFIMAIELYNKPTIKYRIEGFSFFICNAWELMLKSHMSKNGSSIYFKDNPYRTISLENCIEKIFTNKKSPLRLNLEKIIELRNTSTHFITEEYEMVYVPLFQSCVLNFTEKLIQFHGYDITELIPQNFLTLVVSMKALQDEVILAKYPEEIASKLITVKESIDELSRNNNNSAFSIKIEHYHFITKDINKATTLVNISRDAEASVKIIKELKDPNLTHNFSAKKCIEQVNSKLSKFKINLTYENQQVKFNMYHFTLFCNYYEIKKNKKLCFIYEVGSSPKYSYSMQAIDFIVDELRKDSNNIIRIMKEHIKK